MIDLEEMEMFLSVFAKKYLDSGTRYGELYNARRAKRKKFTLASPNYEDNGWRLVRRAIYLANDPREFVIHEPDIDTKEADRYYQLSASRRDHGADVVRSSGKFGWSKAMTTFMYAYGSRA